MTFIQLDQFFRQRLKKRIRHLKALTLKADGSGAAGRWKRPYDGYGLVALAQHYLPLLLKPVQVLREVRLGIMNIDH